MSWAKPPRATPVLSARIAFADSDPKPIADTFSSAMSYGCVQCGPPTRTRGGLFAWSTGCIDGTRNSSARPCMSRSLPNGSSASTPLARSYTMDRVSRSNGRPSKLRSTKYCWSSGRIASRRKRACPMTG
ncbi:hypothetical protein GCM10010329_30300 [Streptomyces spiroverticillatus]|uniref:Uncharacterized protein n=1 Tax=Streptomyces finlayi TaxID=67296 RepID=A0A919C9B4_9ACTN|nr:hypothetical protein GCM10010329_30300 [Streptomyces spiroverticillatus]GHC89535.1 hypothetical protein GCM10010334_22710 [Streptomyces finlayi]